jgi:hypothetical protein
MGKRVMTVMLIILGVVVLWFWTTQPVFEKSFHLGEDGLIDPAPTTSGVNSRKPVGMSRSSPTRSVAGTTGSSR